MSATRRETRLWLALLLALLLIYVVWPGLDLPVSAWFYRSDSGFWIDDQPWVQAVHHTVPWIGRLLLVGFQRGATATIDLTAIMRDIVVVVDSAWKEAA